MKVGLTTVFLALLLCGCTENKSAGDTSCETYLDAASCVADKDCGWRVDKGNCTVVPRAEDEANN